MRLLPKRAYGYSAAVSDEDAIRNMNYLAHTMRKVRASGGGVPMFPISYTIKKCYKTILRKEREGEALFDFEKWIKENYRLLSDGLRACRRRDFSLLPHCEGVPRIVRLADYIVKCSGGRLDRGRIECMVGAFNAITPLTFPELEELKRALSYILLGEISVIAEKSVYYYLSRHAAKSGKFRKNHAATDSYLYYYSERMREEGRSEERRDIDFRTARIAFENVLVANESIVSGAVASLRALDEMLPTECYVAMSKVNAVYLADEDYRSMSDTARKDYLLETFRAAKRIKTTESVVANAVMHLASEHKVHFGKILYRQSAMLREYVRSGRVLPPVCEAKRVQGVYCTIVLAVSILLAAFPAYYLKSVLAYFAVLPLFLIALHPVEYMLKRLVGSSRFAKPLPQMEYDSLPEACATVVAVARYIASERDVDDAVRQIETLAASFRDENVSYAVVADLPARSEEWAEDDEKIARYIREKSLSEKVGFYLRKRVKKGEKWVAYERKRGALLDFLEAVETGDESKFLVSGHSARGRFAILLDDDSEVLPGTLRSAVFAMAHPLNAEYDLMAFGGRVNRFSLTTYYSEKYARNAAIDAYPFYSDFYSDRFDCALYCGKAIVRIEPYLSKLRDFFPDDRILSHDLIEGAVLRSTSLKRCVYEDAPLTFASDQAREMRWQRGDVQLLPYVFCDRVKGRDGTRRKNPIDGMYKLILFINGTRVLSEACVLALAIAALVLSAPFVLLYAVSIYLFPYAYSLLAESRLAFAGIRFIHAIRVSLHSLSILADRVFLLPFRAVNGLYLFFATCFRMAVRSRDLLSWTPFKATQGSGEYDLGAKMALPSYVLLSIAAITIGNVYFVLYALLCGIYLLSQFFLGRERSVRGIAEGDRNRLLEYARKIFSYFTDREGEGLIPDNVQFFPYETAAKMTSPTNLGFQILSYVSASLLGLIDATVALGKIEACLNKIDRLEKWRGHLYNWYNVRTFEPMPPRVVSAVDSANLVACCIVAKGFAEERGARELAERLDEVRKGTDLGLLAYPQDKMLAIVYNETEGKYYGKYDLLASEARLAYWLYAASADDPRGYFSLGRDCSPALGNTLLSWSGTAFEYMLPRLFMEPPTGSLLAVQEENSFRVQRACMTNGVFGRSECGYAEFDDSASYRYKAVGAAPLALSGGSEDVVAPYASFLYLSCDVPRCLANLERLKEEGLEGKYGFYEAIDFSRDGALVRSFMTHHQGMSLAAIANALTGDEIARLFLSDASVRAVRLLAAEENIYVRPAKLPPPTRPEGGAPCEMTFEPHEPAEVFAVKTGDYAMLLDSLGRGYAKFGDYYLLKWRDHVREKGGFFFEIKEGDKTFSPTYYPRGNVDCRAVFGEDSVRYEDRQNGVTEECYVLTEYDGEMRRLTVRNDSDEVREVTVSVYGDVMLATRDAYDSHPAYSDMFVRAEFDERTGSVILSRRDGECEVKVALAMNLKGVDEIVRNCNRYNVRGRSTRDLRDGIHTQDAPPFGDVLYPCCAASGVVRVPPHGEAKVYAYLLAGRDVETVRQTAERLDAAYLSGAIDLLGRSRKGETVPVDQVARIGGRMLYMRTPAEKLIRLSEVKEYLTRYDLMPDEIVYLSAADFPEKEMLRIASACKRLRTVGVPVTLVVGETGIEGAGRDSVALLTERLRKYDEKAVVVPMPDAEKIARVARVDLSEKASVIPCGEEKKIGSVERGALPDVLLRTGEGGFVPAGYAVVPFDAATLLPYSNVVACKKGGFVITEKGGGFSFGENAREDKLGVWCGDAVEDAPSEMICLVHGDVRYPLFDGACVHKVGSSTFSSVIGGKNYLLHVYPAESGSVKVFDVIASGGFPPDASLRCELTAALGWRFGDRIYARRSGRGFKLTNADNGKVAYVSGSAPCDLIEPRLRWEPFAFTFPIESGVGSVKIFLSTKEFASTDEKSLLLSAAKAHGELCKNAIKVETSDAVLDILYNEILPYQVQSARLNGRTGYYQCGGAIGFRDQLQDVLSLLISDPERVREQILLAAAHQYEEGDVQHWWHEPNIGVRTRISDDRLWLAYVTAKYVSVTGNLSILDEKVAFLSSPPLRPEENSRYEIPRTTEGAPLSEHILRAIRISLRYGEHDLLLMGTGDWNDGLDRVGAKGRGESVWLTMFAYDVLKECVSFFPDGVRAELTEHMERLKRAVRPLPKDGRYPLCFTDEGEWLGYKDTPECTIALNPQTWALLSGIADGDEARTALETARILCDEAYGLVKLSAPPFDERSNHGYISAYPRGVRENGGQYTHAAIWYLKALLLAGKNEEAYSMLKMLNPIEKCRDIDTAKRYMAEPYVLAGDVYAAEPYVGRAGWTWYTGSAAWLKYTLTEDFFGIRKRGNRLYVSPNFPASYVRAKCTLKIDGKTFYIEYRRGERASLTAEGEEIEYVDVRNAEVETHVTCRFV